MNELVEKTFGTGGVQDTYDNRDYQWKDIAAATASVPFDWDLGFDIESSLRIALNNPNFRIPVKNQGSSGSCGGQAWSYYAEILEALSTGTFEERSAKYIYAQTHLPGGGSAGRDNAEIFKKQGVCLESKLPSYPSTEVNLTAAIDIDQAVRENAKSDISTSYAQTGTDMDTIAQAMRDNDGVIIGINGENNGTWLSTFPKTPTKSQWRHWLYAGKAKLINGKKYIGVLNSWGNSVGDNGWQYLSEEYFDGVNVWSGWTHIIRPTIDGFKPFETDLSYMSNSPEIGRLQSILKKLGYFPQSQGITGYYGDITANSVYHFQLDYVSLSPWEYFFTKGRKFGEKTRLAINKLII